ncbi:hypothetical protein [Colwellia sp. RSH04]|uniref:hypothetical protein n=1 Tax=Colwellia sp. RSH04 TaxID=2305464 RepID=UPI000E56DEDA|nr:hypothetical protein [Colwellia sp. RSH04]RHW74584.1 hypothetical protein D1094_18140 [Colwellia sp. RSH04]
MSDRELKLVDSIKNSASNIIVATCFMSGVAFFDYMLFIPVVIFALIGFAIIKWKSASIAFAGLIVGVYFMYLLSNDLSQLGLTKLLLIGWVCLSSIHALIKTILLKRMQSKTQI